MELKLFLHIEGCGIGNWYCYETFDEFYEEIIDEFYDPCSGEFSSKEEVKKHFKECPYIDFFEVTPDAILKFTSNEGACSVFPDALLNMAEDEKLTAKDFLKNCNEAGYLGYELFEIM